MAVDDTGSVHNGSVENGSVEAFATRILGAALGAGDILSVYLGDRMGWYAALAAEGPADAAELARRTSSSPRYAREWLEQQAVTGLLEVSDGPERRFFLSPAAAEVLTDTDSLTYLAPLARMFGAVGPQLPTLVEAYRSGTGVSWSALGADARESQADMNRPWYERVLPRALMGVPALHAALGRPGARVADIGCGAGWSSISVAKAYPGVVVDGYDIDAPSIELARANGTGVGRVSFHEGDAGSLPRDAYDVVFAFECLHDMPYPVEVLEAVARSLRPGGVVVVMDEAVAESFRPRGDELERLMYAFSLLVCLPDGMSHPDSAGTGTVMRPSTLRSYASRAGLPNVEVLPIEDFGFWRFYQLSP